MTTFQSNRYNGEWCAKCGDKPRAPSHAYCRLCRNEYHSAYRRRRYAEDLGYRQRARASVRKSLYGVSGDRYTELWTQQGGVCSICLLGEQEGEREMAVDHDHATGAVRGLLCGKCNKALGLLDERPHRMRRAADYLALER